MSKGAPTLRQNLYFLLRILLVSDKDPSMFTEEYWNGQNLAF